MAIQPARLLLASAPLYGDAVSTTVNANGESVGVVGQVRIAGNATGKVISAAGSGKILWNAGAVTFVSLGSTLRVGIQDVSLSTGLEDGTFDVYKEYVEGTDGINASAYNIATMDNGTKTLSDGDLIAIVVEMPVRAGVDSVAVTTSGAGVLNNNGGLGFPYGTQDVAALAKTASTLLYAVIQFDDGTVGWINGTNTVRSSPTSTAINLNSTPDEICSTFIPNYRMQISGISVQASAIATGDAFEVILYRDPYVTPVVMQTLTPDQDVVGGSGSQTFHLYHITPTTLLPGVTYGIALRPTTTGSINYFYYDLGTAVDIIRASVPVPSCKVGSRTNQTGAFTVLDNNYIGAFVLDVCGIDDGGDVGYLPVA